MVNPAILSQQISGGIVFGLSAVLKHSITIDRGRVEQSNFNTYDLLRMDEVPVIDVHIVYNTEPPVGAGESTNPPIVAAIANAVFAATGKRIRHVPIVAKDLA